MSARWLVQLYKDKGILPCRQELPPEAIMRLPTKPEEECIVSLSYPWLTPQHPDPKGFHLSKVAPVLALYMRLHKLADVSVFWDWPSCFQNYYKGTAAPPEEYAEGMERVKRTPDEDEKFKGALTSINDWYTDVHTQVLMQTISPEDPTAEFSVEISLSELFDMAKARAAHTVEALEGAVSALSIADFGKEEHFSECTKLGFTSKKAYDECKLYGFETKDEYEKGIHVAKALFDDYLKEKLGIRCFPGATAVENVAVGSLGAKANVLAGHNIVAADPPEMPYMINDEGREVTAGGSDKDRPTYTCAQCKSPAEQCASCVKLQAFLTPKAIKVGVRVRDLKGYKGRTGVISKPFDSVGDCKMKYDDDGKHSGWRKANDLEVLMDPYDAAARAFCRNPIPKAAGVVAALARLSTTTAKLAFKRNQYKGRGWCYFEQQISQMGTPGTMVLDLGFLWGMMRRHGCEDLEAFVAQYPSMGDEVQVPETWEHFVQAHGEYGIVVNLVSARDDMPMVPEKFNIELDSLVFTNNSDRKMVSKIYKRVFDDLFASSDVEILDFSGLGWAFDVKDFADTTLKHCGERLRILNLSNNYDLQGDLSDIVSPLKNLEELDLANNQAMTGDIKVLEACQKLIKLHLQKCKVSGKLFLGTFPVGLRTSPLFLERTFPPKESTKPPRMAHSLDDSIKNNYVIHVGDKKALKAALPGCFISM